jgi:hypothetical protein
VSDALYMLLALGAVFVPLAAAGWLFLKEPRERPRAQKRK